MLASWLLVPPAKGRPSGDTQLASMPLDGAVPGADGHR